MRKEICLSDKEVLERLVTLETQNDERQIALRLARENVEKEKISAKNALDHQLEQMNNLQRKMDKQESTFATKDELQKISRLVYIGLGIMLAIEIIFKLFFKG